MILTRRVKIQLTILLILSLTVAGIVAFGYMRLPDTLFGIGHYKVTLELPEAAGLYKSSQVTYHGTEVGRVKDVHLTATGVVAELSLRSDVRIPSDLDAQVHSVSAVGEQYVALSPRIGTSPPLKNGDVIPRDRASVPPDINALLDATNRGLRAIPRDNLKTVIDESYTAVGGLGPELSRFIKGSTALAIDARTNLDALTALIDQSGPLLDSQTQSSDSIQAWAANLATVTHELQNQDGAVAGVLDKGGPAASEARALFERLQPTLPIVLANLVSIGQVAVTYQNDLEQLLVLLPAGVNELQGQMMANLNTIQAYKGGYLSFNTNLNVPPVCATGYLPPQQQRVPTFVDAPPRPHGDLYCRVPQDSQLNVRGMRNIPCETVPGKRAPTVKMCENNEQYVPLNEGYNWKGDPNATLSGQDVPQLPPGSPPARAAPPPGPAPPPVGFAEYDPATGTYVGPDGRVYTQADLAQTADKEPTWQTMLFPPTGS
ncbi:MCE family protein [Mycobacterium sp.]|uniref:MCE family protein n=1 Tax=Mycobacterium sp. TaxID=1785 RepID=UPI003C7306E1